MCSLSRVYVSMWLTLKLDTAFERDCPKKCQPLHSREGERERLLGLESTVQCENLCLMSIQHWLIKVTFAHRLSKRMRPMGRMHVCVCVQKGGKEEG